MDCFTFLGSSLAKLARPFLPEKISRAFLIWFLHCCTPIVTSSSLLYRAWRPARYFFEFRYFLPYYLPVLWSLVSWLYKNAIEKNALKYDMNATWIEIRRYRDKQKSSSNAHRNDSLGVSWRQQMVGSVASVNHTLVEAAWIERRWLIVRRPPVQVCLSDHWLDL